MRQQSLVIVILILFGILIATGVKASPQLKDDYPRLANYYLKYFGDVSVAELNNLKKWDLLILPNDYQWAFPEFFNEYKQAKPQGLILAYTYPAMVMSSNLNSLFRTVEAENLWLRDANGLRVEMWPGLYAVNINDLRWQSANEQFLSQELDWHKWDGLMFDSVEDSLARFSHNGLDINGDGQADSLDTVDSLWQQGLVRLFTTTRDSIGNGKLMIINGSSLPGYQGKINGRMFETFPAPWEGDGSWTASMEQYLQKLPGQNYPPTLYIINANTNNTGKKDDYQKMRFGLASTLMGDGYFSFDYGDQAHEQTWWYDEYSVNLGQPVSAPYNLLAPQNNKIQPGLWRRDFEFGVAVVNSTNKPQIYTLDKEELEKIRGSQDPLVNNGQIVNYLALKPNDGLILLKRNLNIVGQTFYNGGFVRVFNQRGQSERNGFFAYQSNLAGGDQVILADIDGNNTLEQIVNRHSEVMVTRRGQIINKWYPFGKLYLSRPSLALYPKGKQPPDIIVGAGENTKPVVRFYNYQGRLLKPEWLAFDKNFRGGINVAAGLLNDKEMAIAVTPRGGIPAVIRLFSPEGKLLAPEWLAFDKNFRGGVKVAIGDINGDGEGEIVAVASAGGGPQVRIFNRYGKLLGQFQAFREEAKTGYEVMINDLDGDGRGEILVGKIN
jgi:hypothetical protein